MFSASLFSPGSIVGLDSFDDLLVLQLFVRQKHYSLLLFPKNPTNQRMFSTPDFHYKKVISWHDLPGADCGSDHELLIAKFRLKLKKIGKTTRPFRYDLNQIPYEFTVEVRNRFKGLDLIEFLKNYEWSFITLYRRQGSKSFPRKRNTKRQNGCWRRPYK